MAVSFDDAWGMTGNTIEKEHEQLELGRKRQSKGRSSRLSTAELGDEAYSPSSTQSKHRKRAENDVVIRDLVQEIKHLRKEHTKQNSINTAVIYGTIIICVLLLVMTLHTYNRLHYTTECLLWHARHGSAPRP